MDPKLVFIGDIKKCTSWKENVIFKSATYIDDQCLGIDSFGSIETTEELQKKGVILIKVPQIEGYVKLDSIRSFLDYLKVLSCISKERNGSYSYRLGSIILSTSSYALDSEFVYSTSLKPYFDNPEEIGDISLGKLKKLTKKLG